MAGNLDIVGGVGVDVVPVIPDFNRKLKAAVLPIADKVGLEAGRKMGERMADAMSASLAGDGNRIGTVLGDEIARAMQRQVAGALPDAIAEGGRRARVTATREGANTGGAFARSLKAKLEAAFKAMPKLDISAASTGVDAELARVRAKLEQLSNKRIGIDVTAEAARLEIDRLEEKLVRLGASHANIAVRADTATARAALAEIRAELDSVDRKDVDVRVRADTSSASTSLVALGLQIAALSLGPAIPIAAAGIGALGAAATAAGAGVGALALVAVPAIKGVSTALTAQTAARNDVSKATAAGANAAVTAQQQALTMASAEQALASAHRNAAQSIAAANRQVAQAERAVADATTQGAAQRKTALDAVKSAEQSLADAQQQARQAQDGLTAARADASAQLKALNDQLKDGELSQREATLRVQQAQEDLHATLADPTASQLQIDQSQLAYDQAVQAAKEQKQTYDDLKKSAADQKKAGVDGNAAVKSAAQQLADAQSNVKDQTKAVADAQANVAKVAQDTARSVADAQQRVSDAVVNASNTQISAAESVATAERGIESARLSASKTTADGTTKADAYTAALAKLTPSARNLFDAIAGPKGLKSAFSDWSKSLQPEVLPIFTTAVDGAKNSLPGLTPLVLTAADAVKELQDRASASLSSPFWQGFKDDIAKNAKPAIVGLGVAFGNVLAGMAGIVDAFLPHMDGISSTMQRITGRFANWGKNLKGSPAFEKFLKYVKDTAPRLGEVLGQALDAALSVSQALAPLSGVLYAVMGPLLDALKWMADNLPGLIQFYWGLFAATTALSLATEAWAFAVGLYTTASKLATLQTWSFAAALTATGWTEIVALVVAIIAVIAALVAIVIYAWNNWDWFHNAVVGAWNGIKTAVSFVWNSVLKPAFDGIWWALKKVGDAAVWLWQNAILPAFHFIDQAARILATAILVVLIAPAVIAFALLSAAATWLWKNAIKPAFKFIGDAAVWLYRKVIKPQFDLVIAIFKALGAAGKWVYTHALKPAFDGIASAAKWLYEKGIKPQINFAKSAFNALGDAGRWLYKKALKPAFDSIVSAAKWFYEKGIKPQFNAVKKAVGLVGDAFKLVKDQIKKQWEALQNITKKPVKFIIDHVYNKGIVPLWNKVAKITGAGTLKTMPLDGFATGGIMSGYSPGRDDRVIAVGGGEAIMRPEWTRAIGADQINSWNAAARSGGVGGVQKAIGAGMPAFSLGGIADDIWGGLKSAGSTIADGAKGTADFITNPDKVFSAATKWAKDQMKQFADSKWGQMATQIPVKMLKDLKNSIFGGGSGGPTGPATGSVGNALTWARTQAGKPYQWGGAFNPSFDCSGFMSSIQKVIEGKNPAGRLWSTASFNGNTAPAGWVRNLNSPFRIGITDAGVGHTAGTLAGVNVESRGGQGVVVGPNARGWNDSLFQTHYGFSPAMAGAKLYDNGGYLPTGLSLIANGTGSPEPVFTKSQFDDIRAAKSGGGSQPDNHFDVHVRIGDRDITDMVDVQVTKREASTASAIDTGRWV